MKPSFLAKNDSKSHNQAKKESILPNQLSEKSNGCGSFEVKIYDEIRGF